METYKEYIKRVIPNSEFIIKNFCVNALFAKNGAPCPIDVYGHRLTCEECWNLKMGKKDA